MSHFQDDKSAHCIPFILEQIRASREEVPDPRPFLIGLNGVQGAGKTTLVSAISEILSAPPHNLPTVVCSVDDLYLPHAEQHALAESHSSNPLVQHRGVPSTHDVGLALKVFRALRMRQRTRIPMYDKSAFNGQGDRVDESRWLEVNTPDTKPVEVIIFEGWCVGFRALQGTDLQKKWEDAQSKPDVSSRDDPAWSQLSKCKFEDVKLVNQALTAYAPLMDFDAFIHIDAEHMHYVYDWRLDQEHALHKSRGSGMTDEQVMRFVDGYYPCYELYTEALRKGASKSPVPYLRLVVGRNRAVKHVEVH